MRLGKRPLGADSSTEAAASVSASIPPKVDSADRPGTFEPPMDTGGSTTSSLPLRSMISMIAFSICPPALSAAFFSMDVTAIDQDASYK